MNKLSNIKNTWVSINYSLKAGIAEKLSWSKNNCTKPSYECSGEERQRVRTIGRKNQTIRARKEERQGEKTSWGEVTNTIMGI